MFAALHEPDYRWFYFGALTSNIGLWMRTVAQGWLVITLTNSPFYLGLVSFCGMAPTLLFSLFGGVIADRANKRLVLMSAQLGSVFFVSLLGTLVVAHLVQIWQIMLIAFVNGTFAALSQPSFQAIVPELVGRANLMNAIALNSARFNLTRAVGPSIGGFLIKYVSIAGAFYCNAATYLLFFVALLFVHPKHAVQRPRARSERVLASLTDALGYVSSHELIRPVLLMAMVQTVFIAPYTSLLPAFAKNVLHMGAGGYGLLLGAVGVGAFAAALLLASRASIPYKGRIMFAAQIVFAVAVIGFAWSRWLWLSLVALLVVGCTLVAFLTVGNTLLQTIVPNEKRGRVMSVWMLVAMGFLPLGSLLAGSVAEATSPSLDLTAGALLTLVLSSLIVLRNPALMRLVRDVPPEEQG